MLIWSHGPSSLEQHWVSPKRLPSACITRDTLRVMGTTTIRELRNHGGDVIDRVAGGEHVVVTRDGKAVAELRPLQRRPLSAGVLIERFKNLPPVEPQRLRDDVDALLDTSL